MYIQPFFNGALSQISYYIESGGEAAIIDPRRKIDDYINILNERKTKLKFIFNTHLHSDFVSGNYDLHEKTNAVMIFGPQTKLSYHAFIAKNNVELVLGAYKIKVLYTPGHTIESSCFLIIDENGTPLFIFTGDTLWSDDVGRPDLMSGNLTKEILAEKLYDSVNRLFQELPDSVVVYPGHYAGKSLGKIEGIKKFTTIGEQRVSNVALAQPDKSSFIEYVINDLPFYPSYFFKVSQINRQRCTPFSELVARNYKPFSANELSNEMLRDVVLLDYRPAELFAVQHIFGSINIEFSDEFLRWVGVFIPVNKKILLVGDVSLAKDVISLLAEIGYENVIGFFKDGLETWNFSDRLRLTSIKSTTLNETRKIFYPDKFILLDVRDYIEVRKEKIMGSINIPLTHINDLAEHLDKNANYVVYCVSGYRSMTACSILQAKGYKNLLNVYGGINLVRNTNPELIEHG